MFQVGLTGGIGSGKSVVARVLGVLDIPVFDADKEGKRLLAEDRSVKDAVLAHFGPNVYPDGELDRKVLASFVFHDRAELAVLNAIVHPAVRRSFRTWAQTMKAPYVVMEAAILVESGGHASFDRLVVVTAPEELRIRRVMKRDGTTEANVKARLKNQIDDRERSEHADHLIINDERKMVLPQVLALHEALLQASTK